MNKELLKNMIKKVILENRQKPVLLEEPLREMATFASAKHKINELMVPFLAVSAFRSERSYRKNMEMDRKIREEILKPSGYSYTIVEGGFLEKPRDDQGVEIEDSEGTEVNEKTYLVFDKETRPGGKLSMGLFELGKKIAKASNQHSFSYGYPRTIQDPNQEEPTREMFIAIYEPDAQAPGDAHRVKEPWAGPWSSYEEMEHDDIYYTKVRGSRGKFAEQKIQEALDINPKSVFEAMKKEHQIKYWKSLKERYNRGE